MYLRPIKKKVMYETLMYKVRISIQKDDPLLHCLSPIHPNSAIGITYIQEQTSVRILVGMTNQIFVVHYQILPYRKSILEFLVITMVHKIRANVKGLARAIHPVPVIETFLAETTSPSEKSLNFDEFQHGLNGDRLHRNVPYTIGPLNNETHPVRELDHSNVRCQYYHDGRGKRM